MSCYATIHVTFFDVIVYLIIMVITVVWLMSAWFLDSELSTCYCSYYRYPNNSTYTDTNIYIVHLCIVNEHSKQSRKQFLLVLKFTLFTKGEIKVKVRCIHMHDCLL